LSLEDDELGRAADFAEDDRVLLEELAERLGVGAVDADDEEARLGPAAEGIAPLAPEVRVAGGGDEALQRGVGDAVLGIRALLASRVGGADEGGGGGAFGSEQLVELGIGLAHAQHDQAVGEDHVVGLLIGLELFSRKGHREKAKIRSDPMEANMPYTPVVPKGSAPPLAPYSPGTKVGTAAGSTVYVSGTLAIDKEGRTVGVGDAKAQTRFILESIRAVLEAAGGSLADIAFNHIFLKDLRDYAAMNEVYREFFPAQPPARYCIRADLVKPEFLVEIASIAHL